MTVYHDYSRAKIGWFFGLHGWQLALLGLTALPVVSAISNRQWLTFLGLLAGWAVLATLVALPVRGRPALGWLRAVIGFAIGRVAGWTTWRARASQGKITDLAEPDLPGVLTGIAIHEAPAQGPDGRQVAIIQDHARRTWAVTASITHRGLSTAGPSDRDQMGHGLAELLDACSRSETLDELVFLVRTVPDDGAERQQWIARHRRTTSPSMVRRINDDLNATLTRASVRTEQFVTLVVSESRLSKTAREVGKGLDGRIRALELVMAEVEAQLRAGLGCRQVTWLTSNELAIATRTGFAPGDRAGIVDALAAAEHDPSVNTDVPWAMAGPSGADLVARHYSHDAWNSVSSTIKLPARGAVIGALAPVLTPQEPGERRSLVVCYPILSQSAADRQSSNADWAADMGQGLREKAGVRLRERQRADLAKVRNLETKLARGNALTTPYAVCTVTAPKTQRIAEYARRLDASVRRAGYAPMRLDLVQDTAFIASTIPLGVTLATRGDR